MKQDIKLFNPFSKALILIINLLFNFEVLINYKTFAADTLNDKKLNLNNSISQEELISSDQDFYLLGPDDIININFQGFVLNNKNIDLFEDQNQIFKVDLDGNLFLPRLNKVYVEGLTLNEVRKLLNKEYERFIIDPNLLINISDYRSQNVYVTGEVVKPGYYEFKFNKATKSFPIKPTLFEAIKKADGITPNSQLENIKVIRKLSRLNNNKKIQTEVNILSALTEGDSSQNIRLYDNDYIIVNKSSKTLKEQFLKAVRSNLNPDLITVYISGRVRQSMTIKLPRASTLNQAINVGGGIKPISGKIEFFRFTETGVEKREFKYKDNARENSYSNPILQSGDIIRVKGSIFSNIAEALGEVARPITGIFALEALLGGD